MLFPNVASYEIIIRHGSRRRIFFDPHSPTQTQTLN